MHRLLAFHLILLLTSLITPASAYDLVPPHILQQLGLEQAWARSVPAPYGADSISDQQLFVHQENPREYVEIVMVASAEPAPSGNGGTNDATAGNDAPAAGNGAPAAGKANGSASSEKVLARIPTDRVGADGKPLGRQEAERLANNEIRRLKRRGIDAKINVRSVPRVHLYSVSADGMLECRDAENGEPVWLVQVGNRHLPFMSLGVSERFVTVINGANLLQVDAATGEVIAEVPMPGMPRFGATNAGDFAMIPMIGGGIQGYPLSDPTIDPFLERVAGAAITLPTKSPDSSRTAWSTDQGFVYVMEMQGTPALLFRLGTDGIVSGRIAAASGDRFFFGSEGGLVYGMRATRSGEVMWSTPLGEPFYNSPLVFEDQVLLRSTYGNLFALQIDNGQRIWPTPVGGIGDLIGVLGDRLFATTLSGAMTVIDLKTGKRLATYSELRPSNFLVNTLTDRLYLVSREGEVQCLRMEGASLPTFNRQPDAAPVAEEEEAETKKTPQQPFPGGADPFGAGGADPFGGGADPFGAGGGADPFGGGNDAPMEDPFGGAGGANDPFGGNPFDG